MVNENQPYLGRKHSRSTLYVVLFLAFFSQSLWAQEPEFTLYEYSPLYLNPANTGNFDGNWRASIIYRNQWSAAVDGFISPGASFDARFRLLGQKLAAGLYFINDASGIGGLTYNKVYASIALEKKISENTFIVAAQGGYVSGKVNSWYGWNPATRDFDAPSGEDNLEKSAYPDLNLGITWKRKIGITRNQAGIAVNHLNTPNVSFFSGGTEKESIRIGFFGQSQVDINDKIFVKPGVVYVSKNASTFTLLGSDFGYKLQGRSRVKQVFGGVYLRNGLLESIDAVSIRGGVTAGQIDIAVNYDVTMSNIKQPGNMGAFEVAIIYRSFGLVLNSYSIPCERF